jgi:hypothetical protein
MADGFLASRFQIDGFEGQGNFNQLLAAAH